MMMIIGGTAAMCARAELRFLIGEQRLMGTPAVAVRSWTVDMLDELPASSERLEIIDGTLYVTPSPSTAGPADGFPRGRSSFGICCWPSKSRRHRTLLWTPTSSADSTSAKVSESTGSRARRKRLISRWRSLTDAGSTVRDVLEWHPAGTAAPLRLDVQELFRDLDGLETEA